MKQVPEISNVKIDSKNYTLDRTSVKGMINPFDLHAIEEAMRIKDNFSDVEIILLSMGPPSTEETLKEALTYGPDGAYLLSDKELAGSDTLATSYTLSEAIKKLGDFDLILCGKQSIDGETGHVGPGLAENLDISQAINVIELELAEDKRSVIAKCDFENGYKRIEITLPVVISVTKDINEPRIPNFKTVRKALKIPINIWSINDIEHIDKNRIGLYGSATKITEINRPDLSKNTEFLSGTADEICEKLISTLKEKHIL